MSGRLYVKLWHNKEKYNEIGFAFGGAASWEIVSFLDFYLGGEIGFGSQQNKNKTVHIENAQDVVGHIANQEALDTTIRFIDKSNVLSLDLHLGFTYGLTKHRFLDLGYVGKTRYNHIAYALKRKGFTRNTYVNPSTYEHTVRFGVNYKF